MMNFLPKIETLHLFPILDEALLDLLRSLAPEDWEKPTLAPLWRVKDIAAHLLDGNLRTLSMLRDGYFGESPGNIASYQDLLNFLNGLNADWVKAMRRISPTLLIELLAVTGKSYTDFLHTLPPDAPAAFSVAWAGDSVSPNWFHIAREYTEKWHHQQQIRIAVGQPQRLYSPELYRPYLETSMRALPHYYRHITAPEGTMISFVVAGGAGGKWFLRREAEHWALVGDSAEQPTAQVTIAAEAAWRIFTNSLTRQEARPHTQIAGDENLGGHILDMLAVMA